MRKIILLFALVFSISSLFAQSEKEQKETKKTKQQIQNELEQESQEKTEDEFGLVVTLGGVNSSDGTGGYGLFGNPASSHINIDNNEIQSKNSIGASWGTLYLNYWGGRTDIGYGSTGPSNIDMGISGANTGRLNAYNTFYVDGNTDQVGIGTSAPSTSLHIEQTGAGGIYVEGDGTGDARLRISNTGGSHYLFDDDSNANALKIESANEFAINTGGVNERLRIDEQGRVAINRTIGSGVQFWSQSDDHAFAIVGTATKTSGTTYGIWGNANGSGTGTRYGVYGSATGGTTNWAGYFTTDTYVGGVLGIGTTSPESTLHIGTGTDASFTNDGYLMTGSKTGLNIIQDNNEIMARDNGAATSLFLQNDGGNVRIGNANSDSKLSIGNVTPVTEIHMVHDAGFGLHGLTIENTTADRGHWTIYADASVSKRLFFLPDGGSSPDAHIEFSTGNWVPTSDVRMKKNIESISNLMPSIMQLNPTKYHMNEQEDTEEKTFGLIAQEAMEIFPGIVNYIEEADQYGLSYTELIPILVAGMQEQQTEIEALKTQLEAFQNLEERMKAIEAEMKK